MKKIVVDWLSLSVMQRGELSPDNQDKLIFEDGAPRIAQYDAAQWITRAGDPIPCARLYLHNQLNPQFSQLKFENWVFYRAFSINDFLNDFFAVCPFTFHHVQRVDIACDTDNTKYAGFIPQSFISGVLNGSIKRDSNYNRSTKRAETAGYDVKGRKYFETLYISKSGAALKIYNKTAELSTSGKKYIAEWWGDVDGPVWRAEISLQGDILHRITTGGLITPVSLIEGGSLWDGFDYDDRVFLTALYFDLTDYYYKFWVSGRGSCRKRVDFLPRPATDQINTFITPRPPAARDIVPESSYFKGVCNYVDRVAGVTDYETSVKLFDATNHLRKLQTGGADPVEDFKLICVKINILFNSLLESNLLNINDLQELKNTKKNFKKFYKSFCGSVSNTDRPKTIK